MNSMLPTGRTIALVAMLVIPMQSAWSAPGLTDLKHLDAGATSNAIVLASCKQKKLGCDSGPPPAPPPQPGGGSGGGGKDFGLS